MVPPARKAAARRAQAVPLARALSKLGVMSRSEAIRTIMAGHVRLGGRIVRDPGYRIVPEEAAIAVNGRAVARQKSATVLLHKPRGVVTTRRDPEGRPTVFDLCLPTFPTLPRSDDSIAHRPACCC